MPPRRHKLQDLRVSDLHATIAEGSGRPTCWRTRRSTRIVNEAGNVAVATAVVLYTLPRGWQSFIPRMVFFMSPEEIITGFHALRLSYDRSTAFFFNSRLFCNSHCCSVCSSQPKNYLYTKYTPYQFTIRTPHLCPFWYLRLFGRSHSV